MTEVAAVTTSFDFIAFFWLIVLASVVAMIGRYIRVPYALALVITGLIVAPAHIFPQIHLEPHILFTVFLPPLLFESAINMQVSLLKRNLRPIALYALAGTVISAVVVGILVHLFLHISLPIALVFGALISPTDPISVIAIFKELGVGKRLSLIMEAESLFNDGIAVVLFTLLVGYALGEDISVVEGIKTFLVVVLGGMAVGLGIGAAASRLTREFDDHLVEITLTTIVAFGSYLSAEALQVSGVIAVVAAGLVMGSYGMQTGMSPQTRLSVSSFWEYMAFAVNSVVFLLVGFEVTLVNLTAKVPLLLMAIAIVLAGRAISIYGLSPLANLMRGEVPFKWQHILFWGGLRGAIPMALVLGLSRDFPGRSELVVLTFGVVLFSLLVQGLSIKGLLRKLGLAQTRSLISEHGRLASEILAVEAGIEELDRLTKKKSIARPVYDRLTAEYQGRLENLEQKLTELDNKYEILGIAQEKEARRLALMSEKSALKEAYNGGLLEEEDLHELASRIDEHLDELGNP